ncbi:hypothetical protein IEO70_14570 [Bacillus sp. AGMB 02131]|uniref:Uncharacterized protein n=1 Tax=Peribacillus faecalis TaxID=2772559 RepID=A0A927HC25_9BACI|nr:hypothetical protein [Peribacillus faecalis]MBD3109569.1 hypothetical protein [Peribacillus faecalis]
MNWTAIAIVSFIFLILLEVGVQFFINYGRKKSDSFIKLKIRAYKERKAQKEKSGGLPM